MFRKSLVISTCLLIIKFDDLFTDLVTKLSSIQRCSTTFTCSVYMINIDRWLIRSFWSHKIVLKNDLEICFYLRKFLRFLSRFSSTALVCNRHFLCQITQYWKIYLKIVITSQGKKYTIRPMLCNLV